MKTKLTVVVASILALLLPSVTALAATSSTNTSKPITNVGTSFRISPVRTDVTLDPGESKKITVYGQNLLPIPIQAKVLVSDFLPASDESGTPVVLLEDDSYADSHSLKRLAIIDPPTVTLQPNVRTGVDVTITAPKGAMAGGYYGAVRFVSAGTSTDGQSGVAIATNIGSLVLLRINGPTKESMKVESFDARQDNKVKSMFTKPDDIKIVARFNNQGNIQEAPFGKVQLKKGDKVVQEKEINSTNPRGNVLPDSIRRFELSFDKIGKFGHYKVVANFGYGTKGELLTAETSFWVIPTTYLILGGILVAILVALAVGIPLMLRSYKRKILRGSRRRY